MLFLVADEMNPIIFGTLLAVMLFLAIIVLADVGRRIGARNFAIDPQGANQGIGVVEGAVFGMMGLLIAFTFSSAAARFDLRRSQIIKEANEIGTAFLRVDLLPASEQPVVRDLFRRYLDSRIATYRKIPDMEAVNAEFAVSVKLQEQIWKNSVNACEMKRDPATTTLVLSSLNTMIDITTTRTETALLHPPFAVFLLLAGLVLCCSTLAGYSMGGRKKRSWMHILGFAAVLSLSIYVIIEIEYPRVGLIRLSDTDRVLVDLRSTMN
jgi:hypothetical protein